MRISSAINIFNSTTHYVLDVHFNLLKHPDLTVSTDGTHRDKYRQNIIKYNLCTNVVYYLYISNSLINYAWYVNGINEISYCSTIT